jgi:serine/threonine-protein kinase HipA
MPSIDIVRLLDMAVFNILTCNTDAHAKNYSIMIRGNGVSLAPMYDVMCGEVWENITKHLAQKIAGESRGDRLKGRHWLRFARECGLNPSQVLDRVGALSRAAITEAQAAASEVAAMPAGTHATIQQARQAVERRAEAIFTQLQDLDAGPEVEEAAHKANIGSAPKDVLANLL